MNNGLKCVIPKKERALNRPYLRSMEAQTLTFISERLILNVIGFPSKIVPFGLVRDRQLFVSGVVTVMVVFHLSCQAGVQAGLKIQKLIP